MTKFSFPVPFELGKIMGVLFNDFPTFVSFCYQLCYFSIKRKQNIWLSNIVIASQCQIELHAFPFKTAQVSPGFAKNRARSGPAKLYQNSLQQYLGLPPTLPMFKVFCSYSSKWQTKLYILRILELTIEIEWCPFVFVRNQMDFLSELVLCTRRVKSCF